jgi:hypothetical protein
MPATPLPFKSEKGLETVTSFPLGQPLPGMAEGLVIESLPVVGSMPHTPTFDTNNLSYPEQVCALDLTSNKYPSPRWREKEKTFLWENPEKEKEKSVLLLFLKFHIQKGRTFLWENWENLEKEKKKR